MKIESFQILREIHSLLGFQQKEQELINEEIKRANFVQKSIQTKKAEREELSLRLHQVILQSQAIEKRIFEIERSLKQLIEHSTFLTNPQDISHFENQKKTQEGNISNLEDEGLKLLDENSHIQEKITKIDLFLKGATESLQEIEQEIEDKNNIANKNILQHQTRIDQLKVEMDPAFLKRVEIAIKKRPFDFLSHLKGGCCISCGLAMGKTDEAEAERGDSIVFCRGCDRIILPLNLVG